jgi:V8-like Glu-specific endopeptidase
MRHNLKINLVALALAITGGAMAQNHPLQHVLPPTDANAKIDEAQLSLPNLTGGYTLPVAQRAQRDSNKIAGYNPATGNVTLSKGSNLVTTFGRALSASSNEGSVAKVDAGMDELSILANHAGINTVFGADDRVRINPTTGYPWSTVCKLYMRFPDGSNWIASGVMINAKYMLTAGHCVYSAANGGWATRIQVVPAQNGSYAPFGSAYATYMRSYVGWTRDRNFDYDLALVTLDRNIGNSTGWLGYASIGSINGMTVNTAGYPGDRDGGANMYFTSGTIATSSSLTYYTYMDIKGGQSGSGVWRLLNGQRHVLGVVSWESPSINGGPRITSSRFTDISNWINSGF